MAALAALEFCVQKGQRTEITFRSAFHVDLWRIFILLCKHSVVITADEVYLNNMLSRKGNKSEQFGLEGAFKGHIVQPHCHGQGHLSLDQVAQSHPDLEHLQ